MNPVRNPKLMYCLYVTKKEESRFNIINMNNTRKPCAYYF